MTTRPPQTRPWQRHRVRQPRPTVIVTRGTPLAQLTIYPDRLLLARRLGLVWTQYPVAPESVAQALGNLPRSSGLLPVNTLATGSVHGQPFLVCWLPARVYVLRTATATATYRIPLPPLVWAGCGTDYRVFALGERGVTFPTDGNQPLYASPLPNIYPQGAICWGDAAPRPEASSTGMGQAWTIFEESAFNAHIANGKSKAFPNSVLAMWDRMVATNAASYPLDDLMVTTHTLSWLCAGGAWEGTKR